MFCSEISKHIQAFKTSSARGMVQGIETEVFNMILPNCIGLLLGITMQCVLVYKYTSKLKT